VTFAANMLIFNDIACHGDYSIEGQRHVVAQRSLKNASLCDQLREIFPFLFLSSAPLARVPHPHSEILRDESNVSQQFRGAVGR
jgi:hypothetical protein